MIAAKNKKSHKHQGIFRLYQIEVLKKILKYITIFNRLFSPQEDFYAFELNQSMLSWISRAQQVALARWYEKVMNDKLQLEGIARSKTYRKILTENIATLTTLKAGEE